MGPRAERRGEAVRGRPERRGVGAEADEGGLAEGGQAGDAGEQYEAERDERARADVAEERDLVVAREERRGRERGGEGRERGAPRDGPRHSSPSTGLARSE